MVDTVANSVAMEIYHSTDFTLTTPTVFQVFLPMVMREFLGPAPALQTGAGPVSVWLWTRLTARRQRRRSSQKAQFVVCAQWIAWRTASGTRAGVTLDRPVVASGATMAAGGLLNGT